jgi:ATP-binding cassette subfamily F protein 3
VVSHDRHLIKSVADTLWLVADGRLQSFDGDLDDYQLWLRSRGKVPPGDPGKQAAARTAAARSAGANPARATKTPARRDPKVRLQQRLDKVEASIAALAQQRLLLDAELLANPLDDGLRKRLANLTRDAAYLEVQWLEIGTAIEAAES